MKAKKLLTATIAGLLALGVMTVDTQAATRAELASIHVSKKGNFQYWEKNSEAKAALVSYVKDVTNPRSENFIPVEDRIAVFDVDGTLMCETAPYYFDGMFPIHLALRDPTMNVSSELRTQARDLERAIRTHNFPSGFGDEFSTWYARLVKGMPISDYRARVADYMNHTQLEGLNLRAGEAFYLPMVEVVSYLNANKFTVYIVSGSERELLRVLVDGIMDISPDHIIGTDQSLQTVAQHGARADQFLFEPDDRLEFGGEVRDYTLATSKVFAIEREIGKQPVLAFGNSMSDASMCNYAINNNKYRSAAFMLLCDDTTREFGNEARAEKVRSAAQQYGWIPISMRDDFKTIYGYNVRKEH